MRCVMSSGCVTAARLRSEKRLSAFSPRARPSRSPNCLSPTVHAVYYWSLSGGANLNSLPARLFWRACESGRGKSNTDRYLFNESDLLSCLYLLADCLSALLSSFVTLLLKKKHSVAMPPLSLSPSASQPAVMGPSDVPGWSRPTFPPLDLEEVLCFWYFVDMTSPG